MFKYIILKIICLHIHMCLSYCGYVAGMDMSGLCKQWFVHNILSTTLALHQPYTTPHPPYTPPTYSPNTSPTSAPYPAHTNSTHSPHTPAPTLSPHLHNVSPTSPPYIPHPTLLFTLLLSSNCRHKHNSQATRWLHVVLLYIEQLCV